MMPEERARIKIDNQLVNAGWDVVSRHEYIPNSASAVKEALMQGNTEIHLHKIQKPHTHAHSANPVES
mgnify:CR=1 FL=1